MTKKIIIAILWIAGAAAIVYGMLQHNNFVFITGIVMAVIGYIMVRRHLVRSVKKLKEDSSDIQP